MEYIFKMSIVVLLHKYWLLMSLVPFGTMEQNKETKMGERERGVKRNPKKKGKKVNSYMGLFNNEQT